MKKLIMVLGVMICCIGGIALAVTVTTTDGKNFQVTNDAGGTTIWTGNQVDMKDQQADNALSFISPQFSQIQETAVIMDSLKQLKDQALAQYQANQTNGT